MELRGSPQENSAMFPGIGQHQNNHGGVHGNHQNQNSNQCGQNNNFKMRGRTSATPCRISRVEISATECSTLL